MLSNIPYEEMPEKIEELAGDVERLENNWNELKVWLKEVEEVRYYLTCYQRYEVFIDKILSKMQEIEKKQL